VDILYVIDNSGSTLADSFQSIKTEISNTVSTISNEFDYHIYFAPLNPGVKDDISGYPLILSDPDKNINLASINQTNLDNLSMFSSASGNNIEFGISRVKNIISSNRANGIFRDSAHTIVVLISNGNDTEALSSISGSQFFDTQKYKDMRLELQKFTAPYALANPTFSNPLNALSFRFISLIAHSNCHGWTNGSTYKSMSEDIYNFQNLSDSETRDSFDLCSQDYAKIFTSINKSIRAVVDGHKYDHWKISDGSESSIQSDDIVVTKIAADGTVIEELKEDKLNGFEYLGYVKDQKLNFEPLDRVETASGLMIKLNGSARVTHPECILAKTRTPTEYFGFFAIAKEPDLTTVEVEIDGVKYPQSTTDGWSYLGWRDIQNIKVPGPTNVSIEPAINKAGFIIQLHGKAIYSNGTSIRVFFKPKAL
jgi:hypothetical protein